MKFYLIYQLQNVDIFAKVETVRGNSMHSL